MKTNSDLYKSAFNSIKATDSFKESLMKILNQNITNSKPKRKLTKLTAAIIAAVILVLSCTGVYAGVKIYKMYTQKEGKYSQTLVLEKKQSATHPKYLTMNFKYLPKNLVQQEPDYMKYSYEDTYSMGGISMLFYDISKFDKIEAKEKSIIDSEETTLNGNKCLYVQCKVGEEAKSKEHPTFDKHMYIYYEKYDVVLFVYGGTDMSKKLLYKIFDNATAIEGNKNNAYPLMDWDDNLIVGNQTTEEEDTDNFGIVIKEEDNNIISPGESVDIDSYTDNGEVKCTITLDDVVVSDNLNMLKDNPYSPDLVDKNGKIKPVTVKCYGGGDGVNSLDTLKATKKFNVKFIYSTVTYTNNSDTNIKDMCIYQELIKKTGNGMMSSLNNLYKKYSLIEYDEDYIFNEMSYGDFYRLNTNDPNLIDIPAKGKKTVHIGMFVIDDDLKQGVYLILSPGNQDFVANENNKMEKLIYMNYVLTSLN